MFEFVQMRDGDVIIMTILNFLLFFPNELFFGGFWFLCPPHFFVLLL